MLTGVPSCFARAFRRRGCAGGELDPAAAWRCRLSGVHLTQQADPGDGLFGVCLIRRVGLPTFLTAVPRVAKGTHGSLAETELFRSRAVTTRSAAGRPLLLHLDGELREPGALEVEITPEPGRLRVLVGR